MIDLNILLYCFRLAFLGNWDCFISLILFIVLLYISLTDCFELEDKSFELYIDDIHASAEL